MVQVNSGDGQRSSSSPLFLVIGGFLGAGKTSAVIRLAEWLKKNRGAKPAVITNDQAEGLVDTSLARNARFSVREIGGGCFCCRSSDLAGAMNDMSRGRRPDVLIGEPVGSCTDLAATVLGPLRSIYRVDYQMAPLSVLVDPFRAERVMGLSGGNGGMFSPEVNYIYCKQLEEAEIIVVNKSEIFAAARLEALCSHLREKYPHADVLAVSVRRGTGLEEWWDRVLTRIHQPREFMAVNYDTYADGEARLGWMNAEYAVQLPRIRKGQSADSTEIDGNHILEMFVGALQKSFREKGIEVAHLKVAIESEVTDQEKTSQLGVIQWVRTNAEPEFTKKLKSGFRSGRMVLNLRAEADPGVLSKLVADSFRTIRTQVSIRKRQRAAFQPAPPKPIHRLSSLES